MAAQVLTGRSSSTNIPLYTNNTGQNVRIIINFMQGQTTIPAGLGGPPVQSSSSIYGITLSWGGVSVNAPGVLAMGRNLAFHMGGGDTNTGLNFSSHNMVPYESGDAQSSNNGLPTEIMLAPGQTFSASCTAYNIVVIPEAG